MTASTTISITSATGTPSAKTRQRGLITEWILSHEEQTDGTTVDVVVSLSTSHYKERKSFVSTLGTFVREKRPDSIFVSEKFGLFDGSLVTLAREPVARYSAKALDAHHASVLAKLDSGQYAVQVEAIVAKAQGGEAE